MDLHDFGRLVDGRDVQAPDQCITTLTGTAHQHLWAVGRDGLHAHGFEPWHLMGKGIQLDVLVLSLQVGQQSAREPLAAVYGCYSEKRQGTGLVVVVSWQCQGEAQ